MRSVLDTGESVPISRYVGLAIPGIKGMSIIYDSADPQANPRQVFGAVLILEHWLKQSGAMFDASHVRIALRHLHATQQLAATELAHIVYGNIPIDLVRGSALHALLLNGIDQLRATSTPPSKEQRSYLILRQLYVEGKSRHQLGAELGISERHYQRELNRALNRLTGMLQRGM